MTNPDNIFGRLGNRMFQGAYIYAQTKRGIIPDIYLQDDKYFSEYGDEIKKLYGDGVGYLPYVAVHLRRGDYVNNPIYVDLAQTGYYIDATNLFPDRKFLIFSDDIEFAKTYFEGDKFAFDGSTDPVEALNKMASCDGIIMANSSLSWWAGYLSQSKDKKVYPKLWFTDNINRVGFPKDWISI